MVAWVALGVGYAATVLGALTIGVFLIPFVALGTWLLLRDPARQRAWPAVLIGAALLFFAIAFLNRRGPGNVCGPEHGGYGCVEESSPWVWIAIGVAIASVGVALLRRRFASPQA